MTNEKNLKTDNGDLIFVNPYTGTSKAPAKIFGLESFYMRDDLLLLRESVRIQIVEAALTARYIVKALAAVKIADDLSRIETTTYYPDLDLTMLLRDNDYTQENDEINLKQMKKDVEKAQMVERVLSREFKEGNDIYAPEDPEAYRAWKQKKLDAVKDDEERNELIVYFAVFEDNNGLPLPPLRGRRKEENKN